MSTGNDYVFQSQIPQIMSAKSNVGEISQQSADQLPGFCINPVESDKILMQFQREEYT